MEMDITRGSFDDFPSRCSSSSSSRFTAHSSLEVLTPENVKPEQLFMSEELSEEEEEEYLEEETFHSRENHYKADLLCHVESEMGNVVMDTPMEKALRKMKKLEKMLEEAVMKEKEVKQSRIDSYASMTADLKSLSMGTKNIAESKQNINKFLSLMPSGDTSMHRSSSADDFRPIFATQPDQDEISCKSQGDSPRSGTHERRSTNSATSDSDHRKQSKSMKKKFDFIKRNIELAKDAGSYIAMTDDEKTRLKDLLSNIDDIDESSPDTIATVEYTNGYCYDKDTRQRISCIDDRISEIGSQLSFHTTAHDYRLPVGDDDALSLDDDSADRMIDGDFKRLQDIEDRLNKLDNEWKQKFIFSTPRLNRDDLESLLSDCNQELLSLSSCRSSVAGSDLSGQSSSLLSEPRSAWNEPISEVESVISCVSVQPLQRDVLDDLLKEARKSLGMIEYGSDDDETPTNSDEDEFMFN